VVGIAGLALMFGLMYGSMWAFIALVSCALRAVGRAESARGEGFRALLGVYLQVSACALGTGIIAALWFYWFRLLM